MQALTPPKIRSHTRSPSEGNARLFPPQSPRESKSFPPPVTHYQDKRVSCVGHYDLEKTIGQGQFGKVKLARHVLTGSRVAVKIIVKSKLDEETLKKVYREVRIMKELNHPNIIRLYEVIETEKVLFLVMEYASGGEVLDFIITHGKLNESQARKFFYQIVSAVDYCHKHYVIHRDIKCENLLLDADLNIKIIDFGLSNCFTPGHLMNTFCGSPTYCAPELIQRIEYKGPEIDIWSMGVVLFVLVCGYLPFDAKDFQTLFRKILRGNYLLSPAVSKECGSLIAAMLEGDPSKRITVEGIYEHPWFDRGSLSQEDLEALLSLPPPIVSDISEIDSEILAQLEAIGMSRDLVIESVLEKKYDVYSSTYYLLVSRKSKIGLKPSAPSLTVPEPNTIMKSSAPSSAFTQKKETTTTPPEIQLPEPGNNRGSRGHRRHHTVDVPILVSDSTEKPLPFFNDSARTPQRLDPTKLKSPRRKSPRRASQKFWKPTKRGHTRSKSVDYRKDLEENQTPSHPEAQPCTQPKPKKKQGAKALRHSNATRGSPHSNRYGSVRGHPRQRPQENKPRKKAARKKHTHRRARSVDVTQKEKDIVQQAYEEQFSGQPRIEPEQTAIKTSSKPNNLGDSKSSFTYFVASFRNAIGILKKDKQEDVPRSSRFAINVSTTSAKSAHEVLTEVKRVLIKNEISYNSANNSTWCLLCKYVYEKTKEVIFEVEICKLPRLSMNAVRLNRISGDAWTYRSIASQIIDELNLEL